MDAWEDILCSVLSMDMFLFSTLILFLDRIAFNVNIP